MHGKNMDLLRITPLSLLAFLALVGCESSDAPDAQVETSAQIVLDRAASIDAKYCNISGVTVGSTYQDVLDSFDVTDNEFATVSVGERSTTRFLQHQGVSSVVVDSIVTAIASETASHGIRGGPSPGDTREQVIQMFGETSEGSGKGVDVLAYWCDGLTPLGDRVGMAVSITDGTVEAVSIISDGYP